MSALAQQILGRSANIVKTRPEKTTIMYEAAVLIYEEELASTLAQFANNLVNFAMPLHAEGRWEEVEPMYIRALEELGKDTGSSIDVLYAISSTLTNYSDLCLKTERFAEARSLASQGINYVDHQEFYSLEGATDTNYGLLFCNRGEAWQREGKLANAIEDYEKGIAVLEQVDSEHCHKQFAEETLAEVSKWLEAVRMELEEGTEGSGDEVLKPDYHQGT